MIEAIIFIKIYKSDLWLYAINKNVRVQNKGSTPKCKIN